MNSYKLFVMMSVAALCGMLCSEGRAADTCAYVLGTVHGKTFVSPAVVIPVPPTSVGIGQLQLHVDDSEQDILGYTLSLPGLNNSSIPQNIFVPGTEIEKPSYSYTMNDLTASSYSCISFGVSTPAIPVNVPSSALTVPGWFVSTPNVDLNLAYQHISLPGRYLQLGGNTIVIPSYSTVVPAQNSSSPDETVIVDINGTLMAGSCLRPQ